MFVVNMTFISSREVKKKNVLSGLLARAVFLRIAVVSYPREIRLFTGRRCHEDYRKSGKFKDLER